MIDADKAEIAAALPNADNYLLVFAGQPTSRLATDIGFVNFHDAVQHHFLAFDHGRTNMMAEVPRGLIAHTNGSMDLMGAHALLRFAEKMCGEKPLRQGQVRVIEYGAGSNRELIVTVFAVEELLLSLKLYHWPFAAQALRAFGEAQANQKLTALVFGAKQSVYIN